MAREIRKLQIAYKKNSHCLMIQSIDRTLTDAQCAAVSVIYMFKKMRKNYLILKN